MPRRLTHPTPHKRVAAFPGMRMVPSGLVAAALVACFATPALAANQAVNVADNSFVSGRVAVKPGESVTWTTSGSNPHNVAFDDGAFVDPNPARPGPWTTGRTFTAAGDYRYYCEIHGGPGGQGMSGIVFVNAAGNVPPVARFTLSPSRAVTGQPVNFNASSSLDSDGTIDQHEWDLDGNGSFETNSGATPTVSRAYENPGTFSVRLRVTDNSGASDETTRSLNVESDQPPALTPGLTGASPMGDGASPIGGSSPLPPSFAASKKSIVVGSSGRFAYTLRAEPGLTGTISLRSVAKVKVSAKRQISLGTKRFTVPTSGTVKVRWTLSRKNLQILKRSRRIKFRATVGLRNAAGIASSGATTLTLERPRR